MAPVAREIVSRRPGRSPAIELPNRRVVLEGELEGRSSAFPLNLRCSFPAAVLQAEPPPTRTQPDGPCQIEAAHQVSRTSSGNKLSTVILRFSRFWSYE
jgi:hypothetical protein